MTTVTIRGLTKKYGEVFAINHVDLEIGEGELVSLLGPSGCGKTTTLRSIAGFVQPSAGSILFDGQDITTLAPERRDIGMVFQNYALFPHMTVRQNLRFGLEMRRIGEKEMSDRIDSVVQTVQLKGMENRYPRQLSGGQQQRVALARSLVIEPKVLLLDEPLANLDAKLREEMRFFIRSLQKRVGITTVYVTHDQAEAMVISDRIVVMSQGRISQLGNATDIYTRPASREVADFIGLSNFIEGRVKSRADEAYVVDTPLGELRGHSGAAVPLGAGATVVVRPESVDLSRERPAEPGINSIRGKVLERFYLGNLVGIRVECDGGKAIQVQADPRHESVVGDEVWCTFRASQAWVVPQ
ncbi:MAG: ABC transporter ATP-binding protein [Rhizobiaceae bacterium]|jgi:putative spermidine/putrescine transport system ATP-binding protein